MAPSSQSADGSSSQQKYGIITGMSQDGIGYYAVKELIIKHNYHITVLSRSQQRTQAAIKELIEHHGVDENKIAFQQLDVADLKAIKQFAQSYNKPLNLLILNSGIYRGAQKTAEGFSQSFAVNYLGHFYLVQQLTPALEKGQPSRVVWVSSMMHRFGRADFKNSAYHSRRTDYADTKLYMVLAAREFHQQQSKEGISHYVIHPGSVNTKFYNFAGDVGARIVRAIGSAFFLTPEQGSKPIVSAAVEQPTGTKEALYLQPYKPPFGTSSGMLTEASGTRWNQKVTVVNPSITALNDKLGRELFQWTEQVLKETTR